MTVNLRRVLARVATGEFRLVTAAVDESRRRLHFLLCGYVLLPDRWHALVGTGYPLTIWRVVQSVKWIAARSRNGAGGLEGAVWQRPFWERFVRHEKEFMARIDTMHSNPARKELYMTPQMNADECDWTPVFMRLCFPGMRKYL